MVVMATTEEAGEFPVVFSGSHGAGAARGYSGAGVSHAPRSYGAGHYSSGISTGRYGSYGHYAPRSSGEGQIYGSHPKSPSGIGSTQLARSPNYSGSYYIPRDQSRVGFTNRKSGVQPRDYSGTNPDLRRQHTAVATRDTASMRDDARRHENNWSQQNVANRRRLDPQTTERLRNWQGGSTRFADAQRNHEEHWRHHHSHGWWHNHCSALFLLAGVFGVGMMDGGIRP